MPKPDPDSRSLVTIAHEVREELESLRTWLDEEVAPHMAKLEEIARAAQALLILLRDSADEPQIKSGIARLMAALHEANRGI